MATLSIPPSPITMSRPRVPLGPVSASMHNSPRSFSHNATAIAAAAHAAKRARSAQQTSTVNFRDLGFEPPLKRQAVDYTSSQKSNVRSTTTAATAVKRSSNSKRLIESSQQSVQKQTVDAHDAETSQESLRNWQIFYRKYVRKMTFYFDNTPEDVRQDCTKKLTSLGSRVSTFFEKNCTHVVTTRNIAMAAYGENTINPSLLDRIPEETRYKHVHGSRGAAGFQDEYREATRKSDVLAKAKAYNMKIWNLDKLLNFLHHLTMSIEDGSAAHDIRVRPSRHHSQSAHGKSDLSNVLKYEKIHGPTDRDPSASNKDLIPFKGYFIYVRDMLNIHKPILVRDYDKPAQTINGEWPQLHVAGPGRCPFVYDPSYRTQHERMLPEDNPLRKTAGRPHRTPPQQTHPPKGKENRPLGEISRGNAKLNAAPADLSMRPPPRKEVFAVPSVVPAKRPQEDIRSNLGHNSNYNSHGEIQASGLQVSGVTSAIHSKGLSSNAAVPGAKAGQSKGIYQLNRKVFEKKKSNMTRTVATHDLAGLADGRGKSGDRPRVSVKRDPKPGYCENCREKFDDFDEHCVSKRHVRFAKDDENWHELDSFLATLQRPLKENRRHLFSNYQRN